MPEDDPLTSAQTATSPANRASPGVSGLPQARILLVDDNASNLALLDLYLEDTPCLLTTAGNGREALERFAVAPFDLVLMDLEMPVMDGYDATRAIRGMEKARGSKPVPILALTAHALDEHRQRCREAGCTDFLVKPVRKAAMLGVIRHYLGVAPAADTAVLLPARLAPILPIFLKTAWATATSARQALTAGDFETVRRLGHSLKGSAGSYGFATLAAIGLALEGYGAAGDGIGTGLEIARLEAALAALKVTFVEA